jgi:hypothetical protein
MLDLFVCLVHFSEALPFFDRTNGNNQSCSHISLVPGAAGSRSCYPLS